MSCEAASGKGDLLHGIMHTLQGQPPIINATSPLHNRSLWYHAKTLFLFTKSDFKTVIIPHTVFAITAVLSSAELTTLGDDATNPRTLTDVALRMPHMVIWIWINLLVEDLANQRLGDAIAEDQINKPWRPLPSQRITPAEARRWLLVSIVAAVAFSIINGAMTPCLSLMCLVWMYNDLEGSSCGILIRNALNAGGLMCFSWGALVVLSHSQLQADGYTWILLTGAVIMTTVHAQDLPDQEGDKARGRRTLPLVLGQRVARWSLAVLVLFWSVAVPAFWHTSTKQWSWTWVALPAIGGAIGWIVVRGRGQQWDEVAWKLWCLWMTTIYALPITVGFPLFGV